MKKKHIELSVKDERALAKLSRESGLSTSEVVSVLLNKVKLKDVKRERDIPFTFYMDEGEKRMLEKVAKKWGLNQAETMRLLIEREAQKKVRK